MRHKNRPPVSPVKGPSPCLIFNPRIRYGGKLVRFANHRCQFVYVVYIFFELGSILGKAVFVKNWGFEETFDENISV